jgi:hypothetical protein
VPKNGINSFLTQPSLTAKFPVSPFLLPAREASSNWVLRVMRGYNEKSQVIPSCLNNASNASWPCLLDNDVCAFGLFRWPAQGGTAEAVSIWNSSACS